MLSFTQWGVQASSLHTLQLLLPPVPLMRGTLSKGTRLPSLQRCRGAAKATRQSCPRVAHTAGACAHLGPGGCPATPAPNQLPAGAGMGASKADAGLLLAGGVGVGLDPGNDPSSDQQGALAESPGGEQLAAKSVQRACPIFLRRTAATSAMESMEGVRAAERSHTSTARKYIDVRKACEPLHRCRYWARPTASTNWSGWCPARPRRPSGPAGQIVAHPPALCREPRPACPGC